MLTLTQAEEGRDYTVKDIKGDARFIIRITSIGLTTGAMLKVLRNVKRKMNVFTVSYQNRCLP